MRPEIDYIAVECAHNWPKPHTRKVFARFRFCAWSRSWAIRTRAPSSFELRARRRFSFSFGQRKSFNCSCQRVIIAQTGLAYYTHVSGLIPFSPIKHSLNSKMRVEMKQNSAAYCGSSGAQITNLSNRNALRTVCVCVYWQ